jgi:hypothetical protein
MALNEEIWVVLVKTCIRVIHGKERWKGVSPCDKLSIEVQDGRIVR